MSYIINTYNGTQLTVISDGTVNNTTELSLVGKNYSGYGTIQNENFLYLLENFANVTAPTKPISGQLWYDSNTNKLKFFDKNTVWRTISGADVSLGEPSYLTEGDFWFDTTNNQLYVYSLAGYKLIGPPQANSQETTSFGSITVYDTDNKKHSIITAVVNGNTVFTVSNDPTFTLAPGISDIAGFTNVQPGITLINTQDPSHLGYTTPSAIHSFKFFGTATNTDTINVIKADGSKQPAVDATIAVPTVTDKTSIVSRDLNGDITVNIVNGTVTQANALKVGTDYISASIAVPIAVDKTSIVARDANGDITANIFKGIAEQANTVTVSGFAYPASETTELNGIIGTNIVARDNQGDVYANIFHGTATAARYADLAEKYLSDEEYEYGTVVMVGGEKEITSCILHSRAIGVVSENPAFMMNTELEGGTYIALKGRVPVKVSGPVKKGDKLVAGDNGTAITQQLSSDDAFAIALDSSNDIDIKLIEAIIL